jgi:hypothetical protein
MIHDPSSAWSGAASAGVARGGWWALRPLPCRVGQSESQRGELVVGGVPVEAVPLGVAVHRDHPTGADPFRRRVAALPLAHAVTSRLHEAECSRRPVSVAAALTGRPVRPAPRDQSARLITGRPAPAAVRVRRGAGARAPRAGAVPVGRERRDGRSMTTDAGRGVRPAASSRSSSVGAADCVAGVRPAPRRCLATHPCRWVRVPVVAAGPCQRSSNSPTSS